MNRFIGTFGPDATSSPSGILAGYQARFPEARTAEDQAD